MLPEFILTKLHVNSKCGMQVRNALWLHDLNAANEASNWN